MFQTSKNLFFANVLSPIGRTSVEPASITLVVSTELQLLMIKPLLWHGLLQNPGAHVKNCPLNVLIKNQKMVIQGSADQLKPNINVKLVGGMPGGVQFDH